MAQKFAEEMSITTELVCSPRNDAPPVLVRVIEPPDGPIPDVHTVQTAISSDVRNRVEEVCKVNKTPALGIDYQRVLTFRPGAGALLRNDALHELIAELSQLDRVHLTLPCTDYAFPGQTETPYAAGFHFAAQSGADLIALSLHHSIGPAACKAVEELRIDDQKMEAASRCFTDRDAEVALVGPIAGHTWNYLEERAACRVRIFADGIGSHSGIMGSLFRRSEPEQFLAWISEIADAVFVDSRQLLAGDEGPDELDFYHSDRGDVDALRHLELRRLTEMARASQHPFILGGPSVVNGILFTLVDAAWRASEDTDRGYDITW